MFRTCFVATNLVTSPEFQPNRCATMLRLFEQTRNGYVATRWILLSSTAESSATSGYVVVPERSGQSEAWAARNVERTGKKRSFVSNSGFNRCSMSHHVNMNFSSIYMNFILCILFIFRCIFLISFYGKLLWSFIYVFIYCVGAGITTLMSISDVLDPYFFCQTMEKTRSEKEKMDGEVFFSARVGIFPFIDNMIKVYFPYLYLDLACKQLCFPPRKKYK